MPRASILLMMMFLLPFMPLPATAVTLVENGEPGAIVVIANDPTPMAEHAAEELVLHVEKATGVRLEIAQESAVPDTPPSRIYVGVTAAAREHGIDVAALPDDASILRTVGDDLYVLGDEHEDDDPLARIAKTGTRDGVLELLERYVGARWLWPGELGTYVPKTETLVIDEDLDEVIEPAFDFRRFRLHHTRAALRDYGPELERMGVSRSWLEAYDQDVRRLVRRHRVGYTQPKPVVGHRFSGWWEEYGDEHPEWFMMNADGERGPSSAGRTRHVAICVTNEELQRFIVEEATDTHGAVSEDTLRLGGVDRRVSCHCADCRAWDGPQDDPPPFARNLYQPFNVSDRYARFWKTMLEKAKQRNPDVLVTVFLYFNYLAAPQTDLELGEQVYGEFVPWGAAELVYFPMSDEAFDYLKAQWLGWRRTGMQMGYRPNYLTGSYAMPLFSTWQAGEFFQFAAEHGMKGFDFDSLHANWATQGPMVYMHLRQSGNPHMPIEAIRAEYFSAFGPAADEMERFFDYWEDHNESRAVAGLYNPVRAHEAYPQAAFQRAQRFLDEAMAAAREHPQPEFAERVAFIEAGFEHARLASRLMGTLDRGRVPRHDPQAFRNAQQALEDLVAFRRAHEDTYVASFRSSAQRESRRIDIDTLRKDIEEVDLLPETLTDPWGDWQFHKDPDNRGVSQGWHRPETADSLDWSPIEVPAHWQETDLGDYLGYGWYRTTFELPESWDGRNVNLLFESVDEQAWVFVNGEFVGEHTVDAEGLDIGDLWRRPFTIDLEPDHLNPGDRNELMVRVHASRGTGGIWRSVRIYAPEDD